MSWSAKAKMTHKSEFKKPAIFLLLILCFMLHAGTLRKNEDPILKTQTNPILHKQKMEEIKDGEKGAPAPTWKLYPKEKFLAEAPVAEDKKEQTPEPSDRIPVAEEPIPENLEGVTELSSEPSLDENEKSQEEDWWLEEEDSSPSNDLQKEDQQAETL
ncbi:MAG: hypothetical protein HYZ84_06915 [Candidatus Omnitrophica bacterium]|nr:hypothetical protein [Candidatus Omnitrophota bacterium]